MSEAVHHRAGARVCMRAAPPGWGAGTAPRVPQGDRPVLKRVWLPSATPAAWSMLADAQKTLSRAKLIFALPWRRFKKQSVLTCKVGAAAAAAALCCVIGSTLAQLHGCMRTGDTLTPLTSLISSPGCTALQLDGEISDQLKGRFAPGFSLPQLQAGGLLPNPKP